MKQGNQSGFVYMVRRSGWWGGSFFAGSFFFLVGCLISFFEGDMRIALQSLVVALALWTGGLLIYRKQP